MITKLYTSKEIKHSLSAKEIGGKTITVIGDSIPKGLYLQNNRICRIERGAVANIAERLHLHIENFSVFGQTLKKCVLKGHFERWLQEHSDSHDRLVISLGGNDCDYAWKEVAKNPLAEHSPHTPLPEFENILFSLIAMLKSHGIRPIFTSLPPIDSKRYFENVICTRSDRESILQFFRGDITNISRHQECYNAAILKAALSRGCPFLDYRSDLLLQKDYLSFLSDDGIHPNQKGHDFIADFICRRFPSAARGAAV